MSSDSDEDIGLRLQKMKNKYQGDKIESTALLNDSNEIDEQKPPQNDRESSPLDLDELPGPFVSKTPEELPEVKLNTPPQRITRSSARKRNTNEVPTEEVGVLSRKKSKKATATPKTTNNDPSNNVSDINTTVTTVRGRGRGRARGRGKKSQSNAEPSTNSTNTSTERQCTHCVSHFERASTNSSNISSPVPDLNTSNNSSRRRGARGGRSNRRNTRGWVWRQRSPGRGRRSNLSVLAQFMTAMASDYSGHTYVIGDAEDVADASSGQALFSNQKKPEETVDVEEIDENNVSMDDNEEVSVKVHWQSYKYEIFKIRRYQKLSQIFDYFAEKENVGYDKLLFMYNDKIIKPTDTPDSINYNIAKKIEGGMLENSIAPIMVDEEEELKDSIKLKFQCQHLKKPFEIAIRPDEKLSLAMTKCAEYLEKPLNMLRFEFDGDVISGKSTARELELEGGECIDVKVAS